ncbi:hypothetical protein SLA2020_508230 [Shorea laevis]
MRKKLSSFPPSSSAQFLSISPIEFSAKLLLDILQCSLIQLSKVLQFEPQLNFCDGMERLRQNRRNATMK